VFEFVRVCAFAVRELLSDVLWPFGRFDFPKAKLSILQHFGSSTANASCTRSKCLLRTCVLLRDVLGNQQSSQMEGFSDGNSGHSRKWSGTLSGLALRRRSSKTPGSLREACMRQLKTEVTRLLGAGLADDCGDSATRERFCLLATCKVHRVVSDKGPFACGANVTIRTMKLTGQVPSVGAFAAANDFELVFLSMS